MKQSLVRLLRASINVERILSEARVSDHSFDDGGFGDDECNVIVDADSESVNRCSRPADAHRSPVSWRKDSMPPIVSISRRVQGPEALAHFAIIEGSIDGGAVCVGCGTHLWDRVSPVELSDGGSLDADSTWDCSPLCRVCSYRSASRIVGGAGWSGLESGDVAAVWQAVRDEQARELENELARERATALDELQAAHAATEALMLGKTDTQIAKEMREAREALRVLERAQETRCKVSSRVAQVIGGKQ